jgi:uncharacterized membrane protein YhaH (DUF805 family)
MPTCSYCGHVSEIEADECPGFLTFYCDETRERVEAELMAKTPPPSKLSEIYFSLEGRLSQERFWKSFAAMYALLIGLSGLAFYTGGPVVILFILVFVLSRWGEIALLIKRMKDYDRTPSFFVFACVIPGIGTIITLLLFLEGLIRKGTVGPNRFGLDPLNPAHESPTTEAHS